MSQQKQFLDVVDRDQAKQKFESAISLNPVGEEWISLNQALGRILSRDVVAKVNVPSFDRSNLDGYAVKAADTVGAEEYKPLKLQLVSGNIAAGSTTTIEIEPGCAMLIATGGMIPRGADAIIMVEHADQIDNQLLISRAVSPGNGIAFTGTDVSSGETILYKGDELTSRETGILAALGETSIPVYKKPKIAIISTGNEIIAPGSTMKPGFVFDSNARIIADAIRELGAEPIELGIVNDEVTELRNKVHSALPDADMVILSGGTSKGQGDLSYQVAYELDDPGVLVHGVALKPGKPICLAATQGKPLVVLPGFPTSAIFTFHELIAPVIRCMAGLPHNSPSIQKAELAVKVKSEIGRTEFLLVRLLHNPQTDHNRDTTEYVAYPIGKGSGSVTTFSQADGFVAIDKNEELVEAGAEVKVQLISTQTKPADLVIIGSHCAGLDLIISLLKQQGINCRFMSVGSSAGLAAIKRGQCDIAGMHLYDPNKQQYNLPFLNNQLALIQGYTRQQGLIFRKNDSRFQGTDIPQIIANIKQDPTCMMINRNQGSGTRVLIDQLLNGDQPNGYLIQTSNHRAVLAAIQQSRADWGVAIEPIIDDQSIGFMPIQQENYDFVVSENHLQKPSVQCFIKILQSEQTQSKLRQLKIDTDANTGAIKSIGS